MLEDTAGLGDSSKSLSLEEVASDELDTTGVDPSCPLCTGRLSADSESAFDVAKVSDEEGTACDDAAEASSEYTISSAKACIGTTDSIISKLSTLAQKRFPNNFTMDPPVCHAFPKGTRKHHD